jgi:hypothetical protein
MSKRLYESPRYTVLKKTFPFLMLEWPDIALALLALVLPGLRSNLRFWAKICGHTI